MNRYNNPNELYHYGVLGMKWGKRKQRTRSEDSARLQRIRKKRTYELSNEELNFANKRLEAENKYRNHKRNASVGRRFVNTYIATAGTIAGVASAAAIYSKYGSKAKEALRKLGPIAAKACKLQ